MVARPTWQGRLKLSLVSCPVSLFTATTSANDVRFHLINPETNNRIRMVPTDPDTGPVERSDLVRGYEVKKDEYVLFDDADFDKVKLESTKAISIDRFVDEADIDRLYWDTPHYMVPDKDMIEIAHKIIGQKEADFDPAEFKDGYDDALREMINAKTKGKKLVASPEPEESNVVDLMEALKNSLKGSATAKKAPAKKTAAKSAPRKKAG